MKLLPHAVWDHLINPMRKTWKKWLYHYRLHRIPEISYAPGQKVLIIAASAGIGNAVEATPLVQAVRIMWPKCHLTFAAPAGDLFSDWCLPDRVVTDPQNIKGETFQHTFFAYIHEDIPFWTHHCNLGHVHRTEVLFNKWFLKHEREYYMDMAKRLGYKGPTPPVFVNITGPKSPPPQSDFRISIAPGGKNEKKWKHKKWPYYAELISRLETEYPDCQICIVGTKNDELPDSVFRQNNVIDCRGAYSLSETAWLLQHSDLVIGNDCGPMHIADAVQSTGLTLFGPTCVIKNTPTNKVSPLSLILKCSPCHYYGNTEKCTDAKCINSITTDRVFNTVRKMIDR